MASCSCETRREIWTVCAHTRVTTALCWQPGSRDCARAHKFDMHIGWCAACEDYYGSNALRRDGAVLSFWRHMERSRVGTPMFPGFVPPDVLAGNTHDEHDEHDGISCQVPAAPCRAFVFALGNMMRHTGDGRRATHVATGRPRPDRADGCGEGIAYERYAAYVENAHTLMVLTLDWARANVMRPVDVDPYAAFDMVQMYDDDADDESSRCSSPSSVVGQAEPFPAFADEPPCSSSSSSSSSGSSGSGSGGGRDGDDAVPRRRRSPPPPSPALPALSLSLSDSDAVSSMSPLPSPGSIY